MADNYIDIEVRAPEHKRRSDVLTPVQAFKAKKSSKNHKMKPRTEKRDSTKTREMKNKTKDLRRDMMMSKM